MFNENDRAAAALMDDYLKVHNRLARQRKAERTGKQPKRTTPPVHSWRAEEGTPRRGYDDIFHQAS